jgi:phosphotransferase system HPr (HPr) family protein
LSSPTGTSNKLIINPADVKRRRESVERFTALLTQKTVESDWQSFFDANPFILTESLSLKLDGLYRQVPLVSGKPDYVFYRSTGGNVSGDFGVIELKRPDHSILGVYSSRIVAPSKHLRIAQQQASVYLDSIQRGEFLYTDDFFVAGNRRHAFIIIGRTAEITQKCRDEVLRSQFLNLLPPGFNLFTYDELFRLFKSANPPIVHVLIAVPSIPRIIECQSRFTLGDRINASRAAFLAGALDVFESDVDLLYRYMSCDAKRVSMLVGLRVPSNATILLTARGPDAEEALRAAGEEIAADFDLASRAQSVERIEREMEITWTYGLHIRPCVQFIKTCSMFNAKIFVSLKGNKVEVRDILSLLALTAPFGTTIKVEAEGYEALAAVEALDLLVRHKFYMEPENRRWSPNVTGYPILQHRRHPD